MKLAQFKKAHHRYLRDWRRLHRKTRAVQGSERLRACVDMVELGERWDKTVERYREETIQKLREICEIHGISMERLRDSTEEAQKHFPTEERWKSCSSSSGVSDMDKLLEVPNCLTNLTALEKRTIAIELVRQRLKGGVRIGGTHSPSREQIQTEIENAEKALTDGKLRGRGVLGTVAARKGAGPSLSQMHTNLPAARWTKDGIYWQSPDGNWRVCSLLTAYQFMRDARWFVHRKSREGGNYPNYG